MKVSGTYAIWAIGLAGSLVLAGCVHFCGGAPGGSTTERNPQAMLLPAEGPTEAEFPALHNLMQITGELYSGGEPVGTEAFKSLSELGVKIVVSVDGARPDVESAGKFGLRYVHIPIGYDGIDEAAGNALARLMRDEVGPVYVHCHHGKHRGPAAAAVACIAAGDVDGQGALVILERAGTSKNYGGLWRDVAAYRVPGPEVPLPQLVETAEVSSLAAAMAVMDRATDNLALCRDENWKTPPSHPDLVPAQEALLVRESLHETARLSQDDFDAQFRTWLSEAEVEAERLEAALQTSNIEAANRHYAAVRASCTQCHKVYRD